MSKEIWLCQKILVQMNGQKHPSGSFSIIQQKCQRCNQKQRHSELKSSDQPLCGNMWKLQWGLSSFYRWWFILEQNREEDKPKRTKADTSPNPVIFSAARFLIHYFLPLFFCRQIYEDPGLNQWHQDSTFIFVCWQLFHGKMTNNRKETMSAYIKWVTFASTLNKMGSSANEVVASIHDCLCGRLFYS